MTTPAPPAPPAWTLQGLVRSLGIACLAIGVGAGVGYLISHERPPRSNDSAGKGPRQEASASKDAPPAAPARPPPAGPAELALLAPLREGGEIGGYAVIEIDAVSEGGLLRLVCRKGDAVVKLDVALGVDAGPSAPAVAGKYAVFYGTEGPASPGEGEALARALAALIEPNASVPAPPRLGPFVPQR